MSEFFVNFFVWWYAVRVKDFSRKIYSYAIFILEYTNTLPMAQNLFVPMFQDNSGPGKFISFLIRVTWVWMGGMASAFFIIPMAIVLIVYLFLPVILILMIIIGLLNMLGGGA